MSLKLLTEHLDASQTSLLQQPTLILSQQPTLALSQQQQHLEQQPQQNSQKQQEEQSRYQLQQLQQHYLDQQKPRQQSQQQQHYLPQSQQQQTTKRPAVKRSELTSIATVSSKKEILCEWENITMMCGEDEVVMVTKVMYGQMEAKTRCFMVVVL